MLAEGLLYMLMRENRASNGMGYTVLVALCMLLFSIWSFSCVSGSLYQHVNIM
jgi:hypothetical protein